VARSCRAGRLAHIDWHEANDSQALADVALATDCVLSRIEERCSRPLFAGEAEKIWLWSGRVMPKKDEKPEG